MAPPLGATPGLGPRSAADYGLLQNTRFLPVCLAS